MKSLYAEAIRNGKGSCYLGLPRELDHVTLPHGISNRLTIRAIARWQRYYIDHKAVSLDV